MTDQPSSAGLADAYVSWFFANHPGTAQALGAPGFAGDLGDYSATAFQRRQGESETWLARFEAEPPAADLDDEIDRRLAVAHLRGERAAAAWPAWRRDPSVYLSAPFMSLLLPYIHALQTPEELAADSVAKLGQLPAVLAACRENLDPALAAPLLVGRGLGQARTGRAFVTATLPALLADERLSARVAEAAGPAADAFDELAAHLARFQDEAHGDWRMGEQLYSTLLRERELLGYGAPELRKRGEAAYAALAAEMSTLAGAISGSGSGAGSGTSAGADGDVDWRAVMEELQADHPPTPEAMREEYEAETERARRFVREHGLVSFAEGEQCRVVPSPAFQRPILSVASYMSPPPLTASRTGHFFVPYPPEDFTAEQVRQRLATNSRAQLPTIAVHEAYPGHHWHLTWSAASPRTLRKVVRTPYFSEGWALYVETLMREHGYFADPRHEIAHVEARLFRAARIIVDTALHCGDMTVEEAERFMAEKTALSPGTAKGEVSRYCAWPTQAPSYLTGCLEIERIRADYTAAGRGSLREFHDTVAGSGSLPLGLARAAALGRFED